MFPAVIYLLKYVYTQKKEVNIVIIVVQGTSLLVFQCSNGRPSTGSNSVMESVFCRSRPYIPACTIIIGYTVFLYF